LEAGRLLGLVRGAYPVADVVRIREACAWAARLHLGQRRRSGEPYITHPVAVALLAVRVGARGDVVCAALLHDVLEDTPCTAELRAEFGASVATSWSG
jgi:GTP diphosphokinase / guanosine-3',5'-bis(diphosphate) 3'-diphosphatase